MTKKSDAPAIRFKGFSDAWEQRKVQDVANRFDNLRIPVAANLRVHGTTPYYGANGIQDYVEGFTHDGEFVLVAEDGANDLKNYPVKCVNGRIWVNNHAHVLQGKAGIADNSFLAFAISQSDIESLLVGGGRAKLNAETLMSIEFRLPCLQEQYRIGEYLTQLDHLITLHQRKCANLCSPSQVVFSLLFATSTFSWEQRKAKEICSIGTGKSNTQDQVDDGKYPFYIRSDVPVRSNKYLYDCEAVITIGDGNIGKVFHYVNGKFDLHQRCYKMTDFKDIWGKYFFYYFSTKFYDRAMKMTAKATVDSVRLEMISEMDIKKPPQISEQKQIAEFFANLDNLITLHQRKFEKLTNVKKSMLEKMFPQNGSSYPEIRFKGFTDPWEQRKVGDLLIERNQQAPMSDEYPLMAFIANEGVAPKGERYDRSALVTDTVNKLYKKTEKGDFIYSSNNLETGSIGLNKYGKACISPVYSIFEPTGIADSDFLGRRLVRKDFINAMVKWRQGVIYGQWRIHESDFLKIEITVPSVEEQRKIGTYLDQLDHLITLHQRKPFLMKWRTSDANRNQTNRLVL